MLDRWTMPWSQAPLKRGAVLLARWRVRPVQVTLGGFAIGMLAMPLLAAEAYGLALVAILANRLADGLDGALALGVVRVCRGEGLEEERVRWVLPGLGH